MTPQQHLSRLTARFPSLSGTVNKALRMRAEGQFPDWPKQCFIPTSVLTLMLQEEGGHDLMTLFVDAPIINALTTWRYSQGIYRFYPDVLQALAETDVSGDLPSEVLTRLPDWCVYVETPGFTYKGEGVEGFFAYVDWGSQDELPELNLLLNLESGTLHNEPVYLGRGALVDAFSSLINGEKIRDLLGGGDLSEDPIVAARMATETAVELKPFVSLLLYLCSDAPEIDDSRVPGTSPHKPEPRKTKRGWSLFPADKVRFWDVAAKAGESLRRMANAPVEEDGPEGLHVKVRTHLRRAHWHGFWTGPRNGERLFKYKWLPPIIVNPLE